MSAPSSVISFFGKISIPVLGDIPLIGPVFFQQDLFVYLSYIMCGLAAVYMYRTRMGMNLKALGESNAAADASGINVALYKYIHILIGSSMRSGRRLSFPGEDAHMAGEYRQRPRLDSGSPGNIRGVESYQRFFRRGPLRRPQHPGTQAPGHGIQRISVPGGYDSLRGDHTDSHIQYI